MANSLPYPMPLSMRDTVNMKLGDRQMSALDANGRFIVRALVAEAYAEGHRDGRVDEMHAQSVERDLTPKPAPPIPDLSGWADYFEGWGSHVGDAPFTQAAVVKTLRGSQPFGVAARENTGADE